MRAARLWCAFTTPSMAIAYASSLNPKPQVRSPGWPSRGRPRPQRVHSGPALRSLTHAYYMHLLITRRGSCATPSTRVRRAKRRFSSRHSRCHSRSPRVGASVSVWRTGGLWRGASTDSGCLMRPNLRHQSSLHRPRLHTVIHLINNTKTSQRPHSTRTHALQIQGLPEAYRKLADNGVFWRPAADCNGLGGVPFAAPAPPAPLPAALLMGPGGRDAFRRWSVLMGNFVLRYQDRHSASHIVDQSE